MALRSHHVHVRSPTTSSSHRRQMQIQILDLVPVWNLHHQFGFWSSIASGKKHTSSPKWGLKCRCGCGPISSNWHDHAHSNSRNHGNHSALAPQSYWVHNLQSPEPGTNGTYPESMILIDICCQSRASPFSNLRIMWLPVSSSVGVFWSNYKAHDLMKF